MTPIRAQHVVMKLLLGGSNYTGLSATGLSLPKQEAPGSILLFKESYIYSSPPKKKSILRSIPMPTCGGYSLRNTAWFL